MKVAVILSEAKDLQFRSAEQLQILRFAQNDRLSREFPWAFGPPEAMKISAVVPAKAGTHRSLGTQWIPAFAGMTYVAGFSGEYPWACSPPQPMKVEHEGLTVENDDML